MTRRHDHEWHTMNNSYPIFEDKRAFFHEVCEYAPVLDTYTDTKRDEVYHETGPQCSEERFSECNPQKIKIADVWVSVQDYWDEDVELSEPKVKLLESATWAVEQSDPDRLSYHDIEPAKKVEVTDESGTYRVVYSSE